MIQECNRAPSTGERTAVAPSRDVPCVRTEGSPAAGFSDAAILDIYQVTAYFAFANRIAEGLGIELES